MFRKIVVFVCAIACMANFSFAQVQPCATDDHYHKLLEKYPQLAMYEQQFKAQINDRLAERTSTAAGADTTTYDVPLVVHVIHDYGVENLSDDALYEAAAYWSITYNKQNADTADVIPPFIPYIGNARIRLHLATIDPNGKPTHGIVRVQSYLANLADDEAKYGQWPQNQYVNIWFVGTFGGSVGAGVVAYAILPSTVSFEPYYDGVICLSSAADPSTKTVPHEIGHVFNLLHPWGNTNNPAVACGDDGVDDTPPTLGHWNFGCIPSTLYDTTCATGYNRVYFSADGTADSLVDYPDTANSQNIMDYTDCQKMFTIQQTLRMRAALTSATAGRSNLITPANLAATGALAPRPDLAPIADFIVNKTNIGTFEKRNYYMTFNNTGSFVFQNESWNDTIASVAWTFSNGASTPTSTSAGTVLNKFTQPGWVTVSLIANSNAGSDTVVNTHAVYVADTTPVGGLSYRQDFTSPSAIGNWPMFNYYNNQFKWNFFNGAGLGDNTCIQYRSFDTSSRITGIAIGDFDDFFTPAFNIAGASSAPVNLNFYTAGAYTLHNVSRFDPQQDDSLEIDASIDGGAKWTKLTSYHSSDLENNGAVGTEFVPTTPSQWVARTVAVPAAFQTAQTFFRFRMWPGNLGDNLYLDHFSLSPFPAGVKEVLSATGTFDIFPNPTGNGCTLIFKTGNTGIVNYSIKDITGKTVYQDKNEYPANTIQQVAVEKSSIAAPGMYFVTINVDGENITQKLVVY